MSATHVRIDFNPFRNNSFTVSYHEIRPKLKKKNNEIKRKERFLLKRS